METTLTYPSKPMSLKPVLLILVLAGTILISGMLVTQYVLTYSAHAVERHGNDAWEVRRCLENNDPLQVWTSMKDSRVFNVCKLPDGRFGIQICDGTKECTSFIYRASKGLKVKLEQVENYLKNAGAIQIKNP